MSDTSSSDNPYGSVLRRLKSVIPPNIFQLMKPFYSLQTLIPDMQLRGMQEIVRIGSTLTLLKTCLSDLPHDIKSSVLGAAQRGWFLDLELAIDDLRQIAMLLEREDFEALDDLLLAEYERRLAEIQCYILRQFPHRQRFIDAVFSAHQAESYEVSVLVAFAQVDGMCHEKLGENFFRRKDGKPRTATTSQVEQALLDTDDILARFMLLLATGLPIHASENQRKDVPATQSPSRHAIMHGESLDYGTRLNSLKAISLLNYVCQMTESSSDG